MLSESSLRCYCYLYIGRCAFILCCPSITRISVIRGENASSIRIRIEKKCRALRVAFFSHGSERNISRAYTFDHHRSSVSVRRRQFAFSLRHRDLENLAHPFHDRSQRARTHARSVNAALRNVDCNVSPTNQLARVVFAPPRAYREREHCVKVLSATVSQ